MHIKSKTWQWLAVASGCTGLLFGLGIEGDLETIGQFDPAQAWTAAAMLAAALIFMRLHFAAYDREQAARRHRYGKIERNHARNADWRDA